MTEGLEQSHLVFDRVAEEYDTARPEYPEALYLALEEMAGTRLAGARVLDIGAGTGISTRGLLDRGAQVVAADRSVRMLSRLTARTACAVLLADGDELPFRDRVADMVTYAQAWHWLDSALSIAEAVRVLRPGGTVAGWWNTVNAGKADWLAAYHVRLAESCEGYVGPALPGWGMPPIAEAMAGAGLGVAETWVEWTRSVLLDDFLTDLRSHSYVARLDEGEADELVARERGELRKVFADGRLTVPMRVYLATGRTR
jgi:SAM-dependent methyltransferase